MKYDYSLLDTANREMKEEIFDELINKLRNIMLDNNDLMEFQEPKVINAGEWRGIEGIEPIKRKECHNRPEFVRKR